eukprot:scaffold645_cov247-Pinguiococcus_pyrenoidosus.AAC.11
MTTVVAGWGLYVANEALGTSFSATFRGLLGENENFRSTPELHELGTGDRHVAITRGDVTDASGQLRVTHVFSLQAASATLAADVCIMNLGPTTLQVRTAKLGPQLAKPVSSSRSISVSPSLPLGRHVHQAARSAVGTRRATDLELSWPRGLCRANDRVRVEALPWHGKCDALHAGEEQRAHQEQCRVLPRCLVGVSADPGPIVRVRVRQQRCDADHFG